MVESENLELLKIPSEQQKINFENFARSVFSKGLQGLLDEYSELKDHTGVGEKTAFEQNMTKNRYRDVTCRDPNRVILTDGKGCDYIHANFIRGDPLQTQFIATQGPTSSTIVDFWRMIQQEGVGLIVMLCDMVENGKKKCEMYYPKAVGETLTFGDMKVSFLGVVSLDQHIDRTSLRICTADGQVRDLRHYHFKSWPDKHVPKSSRAILRLLTYIRQPQAPPVVVHCSAGIGRTVQIAVEMCLQQLLFKGPLSILDIAKKLRDQRAHSIQVETQYASLALIVLEYGVALKKITNLRLIEEYNKLKAEYDALPGPMTVIDTGDDVKPRRIASNEYFVNRENEKKKTKKLTSMGTSPGSKNRSTRSIKRKTKTVSQNKKDPRLITVRKASPGDQLMNDEK